jgi:hypothetical protein
LDAVRQAGLQSWHVAGFLAGYSAEALLALGRTAEAAALIEPLTTMPPDSGNWIGQVAQAEVDLLRGETDASSRRWQLIQASTAITGMLDFAFEAAPQAVEAALWAGRPGDALTETQRALGLFKAPDLTMFCGRLLTGGMRACADLAEQARARLDQPGAADAAAAADSLATWVAQMGGAPLADHPFVAAIPPERATWDAERTRLAGASDPDAWAGAAKAWQDLGCPHRAGYAWWRQAQAYLDAGQSAAADGHVPLLAQIAALAERARIPLQPPAAPAPPSRRAARPRTA